MHWRLIGPFRAGRVTAVAGIPEQPGLYYFGTPGGGVWKSTDAGRVWKPIFDQEHVASIGALAIAPSNSDVIYVGTGEQTPGLGVYRSSDRGATWTNIGLQELRYIQAIIVDPHDPNVLVVAGNSLGASVIAREAPKFAATLDRGIYKTTDGGKRWSKVLTKDDSAGVVDMCSDPGNARVLYASVFHPAIGKGAAAVKATSEIWKSEDEGSTWRALASKGLPAKDRGRLGIVVAPGNQGRRIYVILHQGFFRSDDGGANWQRSTTDTRVIGSEYFSRIFVDPRNPDVVYAAQTSLYRSTDGGHTFEAFRGAPGGDDYHVLWIDPQNPARMFLGVDQGAVVSVDAGVSWTSWYNQPTGQFYHVSTDHYFPYRAYAAQQDSGTAAVITRSDYGQITSHDWYPVGGFEYCFIAPDPLNADLVYSGGWYGSVLRFDKRTGQYATVFEKGKKYRTAHMAPLAWAPHDPHTLYLGTQFLLKTKNGGGTWEQASPDLTGQATTKTDEKKNRQKAAEVPAEEKRPEAITSISLSTINADEIWVGTSDGLVQVTRNGGGVWEKVTPAGLLREGQISGVESSHHAAGAAYVVGSERDTLTPLIARTQDYGRTWKTIVAGLPADETVRVVREDPIRKGLLYAGTQTGVFVSFDDGDRWQPLQLNLPAATVTDLDVHDNDLVASTFGRALWILDDLTPLREMNESVTASDAHLFTPERAVRVRWDTNPDTPYPPETPAGKNPPNGAILNYYLKPGLTGEITLTISDSAGREVKRFSSTPEVREIPPANVPESWFAPPEALPRVAGLNRFVWDLRYAAPLALPYGYFGGLLEYTEYTLPSDAVPGDTPKLQPQGPVAVPGRYNVELAAGGKSYRQTIDVELDPRVKTPAADLQEQLELERTIDRGMNVSYQSFQQVEALRKGLEEREKNSGAATLGTAMSSEAAALRKKLDEVQNGSSKAPGFGPVNRELGRLAASAQSADVRPSETAKAAVDENCQALEQDLTKWRQFNAEDLKRFNGLLQKGKIDSLQVRGPIFAAKACQQSIGRGPK